MYDFIVPSSSNDHKKAIILVVMLGVIAVLGTVYAWMVMRNKPSNTPTSDVSKEQRLATLLRNAPVNVSEDQINMIATSLSNAGKVKSSSDNIANVARSLSN